LRYNPHVNGVFQPLEHYPALVTDSTERSGKSKDRHMSQTGLASALRKLKDGLIVSCQASESSPLNRSNIIAALAAVAERQGAVGVRIDGSSNIRAVRRATSLPIVGIEKRHVAGCSVYITPTFAAIRRVSQAGADIVALDCTARRRPEDEPLGEIVERAQREVKVPLMADVATLDEGLAAADLGVDLISTTLHGYTENTGNHRHPAFDLLKNLVQKTGLPVVLEGRVHTPSELRRAFDLGAYAVVVGTAITNPEWLTRRFVEATPRARHRDAAVEVE
jgi:N-acylglucosamine-6-phosphate 2-epimerase